jgi:hypothetical protein
MLDDTIPGNFPKLEFVAKIPRRMVLRGGSRHQRWSKSGQWLKNNIKMELPRPSKFVKTSAKFLLRGVKVQTPSRN